MSESRSDVQNTSSDNSSICSKQESSNNKWTSIAAVLIALCALMLSVYEGYNSRQHQRLSVRPYVRFSFYYDNKGAHFTLDNWGLGPAQLQWFQISVDNKPRKSWREVIRALGMGDNVNFEQSIPAMGVMMPPSSIGKPVKILSVPTGKSKELLIRNFNRVKLEACYSSLYNEYWIVSSEAPSPVTVNTCGQPPTQFLWER